MKIRASLFFYLVFTLSSFAKEQSLKLEKMTVDEDYPSDCGCTVQNSKKDVLVFSGLDQKAPAIIRLHGKKRTLKWVSSTAKEERPKLGDTFDEVFEDLGTRLELNKTYTFLCDEKDEGCEVTRYSIKATLVDGGKKISLGSLKGDCGC